MRMLPLLQSMESTAVQTVFNGMEELANQTRELLGLGASNEQPLPTRHDAEPPQLATAPTVAPDPRGSKTPANLAFLRGPIKKKEGGNDE